MNKAKAIVVLLLLMFSVCAASAQELKATITVNHAQISGTNKQVFTTLQTALGELLNNTRWSTMSYTDQERIDCTFSLIVKTYDVSSGAMGCEMGVQARRPVFNTSYSTTILNFRDQNVNFTYLEFDRIEVNTATYDNSLAAIMAYYAYLIIGMDCDSYQRLGGTPSFQMAEQVVNQMQSLGAPDGTGWKAFEKNPGRYDMINNLIDERFKPLREFFYEYHRLGLDAMSANVENARARIAKGLPILRTINRLQPSAILITSFLDAKNDELINIFKKGTTQEKTEVYTVLTDINPTATARYSEIKQ